MHLQLFPLFLLSILKLFLRYRVRGGRIGGSGVRRLWSDLDIALHPKSPSDALEKSADLDLDFLSEQRVARHPGKGRQASDRRGDRNGYRQSSNRAA
jgi:hypothetical protein